VAKSAASYSLDSVRETSLLSRISNYAPLFLISPVNAEISLLRVAIVDEASSWLVEAVSILLLYSVISDSHSDSY